MKQEVTISVSPETAASDDLLKQAAARELAVSRERISHVKLLKRSIDARSKNIKVHLKLEIFIDEPAPASAAPVQPLQKVSNKEHVIIVGAGPAGLFTALRLIELGIKPVIFERGKDVRERRRDLAAINKEHIVNPDSNYCFGEGGAGTYSDGKLYTRSTKRGDVKAVLETLVAFGASEEILIEAHPHIGTNKLPKIIIAIREAIIEAGGEIHFNTRIDDLVIENNSIKGIKTQHGDVIKSKAVILATGHSSRDIFELLHRKNIFIEAKPFAMGVRVEHPQALINAIRYRSSAGSEFLPPASYSLVTQVNNRGVYSFCMCPGGIIAPCATAPGEVVTNGWSPSKRNNPYANSGIVAGIELKDLEKYKNYGALAGLRFQQELERTACKAAGGTQTAPAQRLTDFVNGKASADLPRCSYQPGIASVPLHELLPPLIGKQLQTAFRDFGNKMKGYLTNEAVVVGVESRTSSPVRIPRDKETLQHVQVKGLYPCGEGAGYAGGIVSAAIDGKKCAEKARDFVI